MFNNMESLRDGSEAFLARRLGRRLSCGASGRCRTRYSG